MLSRSNGSMARQRQWRGWVAVGFGGMSGPGRDHGASSPAALSRAQYASSSSTVRVVWTAMVASFLRELASGGGASPATPCGSHYGILPQRGREDAALAQALNTLLC